MSQAKTKDTTSRRRFLAAAAVAALVPAVAAAAPVGADAALVDAAAGVVQLRDALEAFLDANDDDDEHPEYQAMETQRATHWDTLATVPSVGTAGLLAKARAVQVDLRQHDVALSLAEDLERVLA
ncbi:hypothetical protein ACVIHI_005787 [Bradyrhizobium sp. USDA 4524]|uniref:hypothetical protein n=1 Tax=unclassified Bradyrhizobium TaxID=2631580 RepID=UPI00209E716B|nr:MULTISPECIES: hypothetical protein [unclassified Bradyrhizobium]MCP1841292.1 hypothetical protein [Bradyrhizobium sp. USDA 4538]MCP1901855.1 hypothetical protein [Bradyrhizobium sp. USDA 4537]MCP1992488.1 hypothetical protein [Bradyrhizobium sp. USDA 4539]